MEKSSRSQGSASSFEAESQDLHLHDKMRFVRTIDSARTGTTALALLMGLTVLGVSANTLRVYNETHVSAAFLLPLWPDEFNVRPTVALVIGSTIAFVSNLAALCCSHVRPLRAKATLHTSSTFLFPVLSLAAALIAIIFYYAVNASETADTFASWTCRWKDVPMTQEPHWDTLCRQSHAGLYLAIVLVPVEAIALGLAVVQMRAERYVGEYLGARKTPVMG